MQELTRHHRLAAYDPTIAVLTATLIALIWTAHYTFRSVRHARRLEEAENLRRLLARMSIAMGVVAELGYLEASLLVMDTRIQLRGVDFLARPLLGNALSRIELFSSKTATQLSEFDSLLRQIEAHIALYVADYGAEVETYREGHYNFPVPSAIR